MTCRCSIVIPAFNKASLTLQCLDALLASGTESESIEIVVVDDHSTDATHALLPRYGGSIRLVTHAANVGFAASCNDGARATTGEYLVFLNNDTVPQPGWLTALVQYADTHPAAAVVGSKLLFPDETIQHAGVVIGQDRVPRHLYAGFPSSHPAVNRPRQFQIVTAACALIRREAFERAGGFDTAFRNGFEDVDLCLRLREMGYQIHYCPDSVLYHLESVSRQRHSPDERHNYQLYRRRWAERVRPDDLNYYVEDGLLQVCYEGLYPLQLSVSPLLAVIAGDGSQQHADRLLKDRSRQVAGLLKEVIRLNVQLREAQLHSTLEPAPTN